MVIEAGVVAGYMAAWAIRKVRRVGGRLDAETDEIIDASLDRLQEVVVAKLGDHPALAELIEEAETAPEGGDISDLTRQQVELALAVAARKDEAFGIAVTELIARIRSAENTGSGPVIAGPGSMVITGDVEAKAESGGIAIGQAAGGVHIRQGPRDPSLPGRSTH